VESADSPPRSSSRNTKGGRALVIDNHPIFGGEAKRNEFLVDGQRLTAHQGSAIFLVPKKGGGRPVSFPLLARWPVATLELNRLRQLPQLEVPAQKIDN